jgi:hypothetical protein
MCISQHKIKLSEPREFTVLELAILEKLMSEDIKDKALLILQLKNAKVIGYCSCGCKTIDIEVLQDITKYTNSARIPVEMSVTDRDGMMILILLHVVNGYINELEITRADSQPINDDFDINDAIITVN